MMTKTTGISETSLFQGSPSPASFVPFLSCMSRNSAAAAAASAATLATRQGQSAHAPLVHAWRIVLKYYELKRGNEFNSAPQRKLSQAWLPDGYSQIFRIVCVWPFGLLDYGSATLRCKF